MWGIFLNGKCPAHLIVLEFITRMILGAHRSISASTIIIITQYLHCLNCWLLELIYILSSKCTGRFERLTDL